MIMTALCPHGTNRPRPADHSYEGNLSFLVFLRGTKPSWERPYEKYPWDGVSGVRPFRKLAGTTTVGVY